MSENNDFPEACLLKIQQKAVSRVHESVSDRIQDECYFSDCGSPIEKILLLALMAEIDYGYTCHRFLHFVTPGNLDPRQSEFEERCSDWWLAISGDHTLFIETQAQLENWRVDFLITTLNLWNGKPRQLIVECDGHEFHERTKRQAARDRARDRKFQGLGYTVFRFTGSEIWRDPCLCAEQISEWADTAKYADKPKPPNTEIF